MYYPRGYEMLWSAIVILAGDRLYGKWLFTSLSLVMSLVVSFCAALLFHEMPWMRSGTELSKVLRVFLPIHAYAFYKAQKSHICSLFRNINERACSVIIIMKSFVTDTTRLLESQNKMDLK